MNLTNNINGLTIIVSLAFNGWYWIHQNIFKKNRGPTQSYSTMLSHLDYFYTVPSKMAAECPSNPKIRRREKELGHSASIGRFVPHYASAVWRKAPLNRTIFTLNLEKMTAPMISMLTSSTIDGCKTFNGWSCFSLKTILELENSAQFCMAKSIQSLNAAIFKSSLKEALAGRQRQFLCNLQAVQRKDNAVPQGKIIMK